MCKAHKSFMSEAVELSAEHMRAGNGGPFGAIIVKDGSIVARGHNRVTSSNDPTAHAEVVAIREACASMDRFSLEGCIIYTSCEPCPMCLSAIYWARLDAVYYANTRKDAASIGFDDDHIYDEIPKDVSERAIPMVHLELQQARDVFEEWRTKPDKVMY